MIGWLIRSTRTYQDLKRERDYQRIGYEARLAALTQKLELAEKRADSYRKVLEAALAKAKERKPS